MGQCVNCNKGGIFVTVDGDGLCKKCRNTINGMIRYHDLIPFWLTLSQDERTKCVDAHDGVGISTGSQTVGLLKGAIHSTTQKKSALLSVIGFNLISKKEYELSEKLLLEAERINDDIIDLHFIYNHLIELTYKQRENPKYLNMCINYCIKDINMYPAFIKEWDCWFSGGNRREETNSEALKNRREKADNQKAEMIATGADFRIYIPSFERLIIICEKRGDIDEAINVCKLAVEYNLKSKTQMGFEGRLEKLKKKL